MDEDVAVAAFGALAQKDRIRILKYLVEAGPSGANAGDIAVAIEAAPSRASFHLSALSQAGILTSERVSRQIVYHMDYGSLGRLISFLMEDCCKGAPELQACCGLRVAGQDA